MGPIGEETSNVEGENLMDLCMRNEVKIMNGFFDHREEHRYTRYRWNQVTGQFDQRSIIDDILTSDKRLVCNVKVIPGDSLDSYHRLLIGDLKIKKESIQQGQKRRLIKTERLKMKKCENGIETGWKMSWSKKI